MDRQGLNARLSKVVVAAVAALDHFGARLLDQAFPGQTVEGAVEAAWPQSHPPARQGCDGLQSE